MRGTSFQSKRLKRSKLERVIFSLIIFSCTYREWEENLSFQNQFVRPNFELPLRVLLARGRTRTVIAKIFVLLAKVSYKTELMSTFPKVVDARAKVRNWLAYNEYIYIYIYV